VAITFAPKRGAILMCDYDLARVHPEMEKKRQALVVSPTEMNHRHGKAAGVCMVIPFSTVTPKTIAEDDLFFPAGSYWSLTEDSWLRCRMIGTVSHDRLDLVLRHGRRHPSEFFKNADLERAEIAMKLALGIP
jgi:uncharacterized protein YifN (PemK superfamily)